MPVALTVHVVAQPLRGMVIVLVAKQDRNGLRTWRFPLTRPLWEHLGELAGAYVADRYAAVHSTPAHWAQPGSLAAAIQHSLRRVEAVFRMPSVN